MTFGVSKVHSHIGERNPFEAASTSGLHAQFQGSQELVRVQLAKIGAFQDVLCARNCVIRGIGLLSRDLQENLKTLEYRARTSFLNAEYLGIDIELDLGHAILPGFCLLWATQSITVGILLVFP